MWWEIFSCINRTFYLAMLGYGLAPFVSIRNSSIRPHKTALHHGNNLSGVGNGRESPGHQVPGPVATPFSVRGTCRATDIADLRANLIVEVNSFRTVIYQTILRLVMWISSLYHATLESLEHSVTLWETLYLSFQILNLKCRRGYFESQTEYEIRYITHILSKN